MINIKITFTKPVRALTLLPGSGDKALPLGQHTTCTKTWSSGEKLLSPSPSNPARTGSLTSTQGFGHSKELEETPKIALKNTHLKVKRI